MLSPGVANRTVGNRPSQRGLSIISAVFWTAFAAIVMTGTAQLVVFATVTSRRSRVRNMARAAASAIVEARPPAEAGGSVAPARVVAGYSDVVTLDAETGAVTTDDNVTGYRFHRQWSLSQDAVGVWVFEASAELLSGDSAVPVDGPDAVLVSTSRIVER